MSAEESNRKNWYVVSQVKSHRVVYFTDDPDYTPPMDGDWYYISSFQGELPADLTLRNCWSWRFNGTEFEDARTKKPTSQAETLLKSNKEALRHLLKEKIDLVRKHPVPNCVNSGILRELRLQEARVILGDAGVDETVEFPLLMNSAAVRGISVRAMAQRTIEAHERDTRVLIESELLRDEIAESINQAKNQSQLFSIRQRLLSEVVPSQSEKLKSAPTNTTPLHFALRPSEAILAQEQLRLRIQLRQKINALRRAHVSEYLLDDVVLRHKGQLARAVLENGGDPPKNMDAASLISHAASRGQTLSQAAIEVLGEMDQIAKVLFDTEQLKDVFLSKIGGIKSHADIERVGSAISSLASSSPAKPSETKDSVIPMPKTDAGDQRAKIRHSVIAHSKNTERSDEVKKFIAPDPGLFMSLAARGLPFVIQGVVDKWPMALLTATTLEDKFGELHVSARVDDYVAQAFTKERSHKEMTLAEYLKSIANEFKGLPPYLGNQALPELTALCKWPPYFKSSAVPKIWLGPSGTVTPLHCDYEDNLFAQIWGRKLFTLYPPHQHEFLYVREANPALFGSNFDPDSPDYEAYPEAKKASQLQYVVEPGELLYLPAGWFHHVRSLDMSLSANLWSRSNPIATTK